HTVIREGQVVDYGLRDARGRLHTSGVKESPVSSASISMADNMILKKVGASTYPCFTAFVTAKASDTIPCSHPVVELAYQVDEVIRAAEFMHDFTESVLVHRVEGFSQVQEGSVKVSMHLLTLLL
ncbi:unnamed protein product, partial [Dibothriocephalus latus]